MEVYGERQRRRAPRDTANERCTYAARGINRQIRKMCESLGLNVLTLKRVAIGSLELGNLKPGKWRKLTPTQIAYLKKGKN